MIRDDKTKRKPNKGSTTSFSLFYHKPYGRQVDILHFKKFSISKIAFLACFCLAQMTKMSNFLVIFRKLG